MLLDTMLFFVFKIFVYSFNLLALSKSSFLILNLFLLILFLVSNLDTLRYKFHLTQIECFDIIYWWITIKTQLIFVKGELYLVTYLALNLTAKEESLNKNSLV